MVFICFKDNISWLFTHTHLTIGNRIWKFHATNRKINIKILTVSDFFYFFFYTFSIIRIYLLKICFVNFTPYVVTSLKMTFKLDSFSCIFNKTIFKYLNVIKTIHYIFYWNYVMILKALLWYINKHEKSCVQHRLYLSNTVSIL